MASKNVYIKIFFHCGVPYFKTVIPKMLQALFGIHPLCSNEGIDLLYDGGSQRSSPYSAVNFSRN